MSLQLERFSAREILDSRGNPTLSITLFLDDGSTTAAAVPSGASTGSLEAVELRDGDAARYGGKGVAQVAARAEAELNPVLAGHPLAQVGDLAAVDRLLRETDGTAQLSRIGANVIVGISMAAARAIAAAQRQPLWQIIHQALEATATTMGIDPTVVRAPAMPMPHFNVVNGGAHADNELAFQEFMLAPLGAASYAEALRAGSEIHHRLRAVLHERGFSTGLGDEGGFAPPLADPVEVLQLLTDAIEAAGYRTGTDGVALALDPAANGFFEAGSYHLGGRTLSSTQMIDYYESLLDRFPVWNLEDGLAEDDWDGWTLLNHRLGSRCQLVGDDIFVTNPATIQRGIDHHTANAVLIKVNQIGTVTKTLEAVLTAMAAGWEAMVSHRSGETPDSFIADLTVGLGCGQLKSGAPARGERLAKYNRLLEIAASTTLALPESPPWKRSKA